MAHHCNEPVAVGRLGVHRHRTGMTEGRTVRDAVAATRTPAVAACRRARLGPEFYLGLFYRRQGFGALFRREWL